MTGLLQPLAHNLQIVDSRGMPTQYFIKWAQQRQVDISGSMSREQVQQLLTDFFAAHELQAGAGISISPDGNIENSPTISAQVQGVLDQLTTTRGSVIFRGVDDWQVLGPGTSGNVLQTNGAGADPTWVPQSGGGGGGGGGVSPFWPSEPTPPVATDYTLVKGPSVTGEVLAQTTRGIFLGCDGAGADRTVIAERPLNPANPWRFTAFMAPASGIRPNVSFGLFIRDSVGGRLQEFCFAGEGATMRVFLWNSLDSFNSNPYSDSGNTRMFTPLWMRIEKSGGDVIFSGSRDGEYFFEIARVASTFWIASPDRIGLIHVSNHLTTPQATLGGTHFMAAELINA